MRLWIPLALGGMIALAYAFLYLLGSAGTSGATFGLANSVGLIAVFAGLLAAGFLLRRGTPPQ
jgi:hypothetical protein